MKMNYICPLDKHPIYRYTDVDSNGEYWTHNSTEWNPSQCISIRTCIHAGWLPLTRRQAKKLFPAAFKESVSVKKLRSYIYIRLEGPNYSSLFRFKSDVVKSDILGERWFNNKWHKEVRHPTAYFSCHTSKDRYFTQLSYDQAVKEFPDAFK